MITNRDMTLYHAVYDPATRMDRYETQYFSRVSVQEDLAANVSSGGLQAANVVKVRIPVTPGALSMKNVAVQEGDRVVFGRCLLLAPPDDAYTVMHTADNRKGSRGMWHYKLVLA